MNLTQFFTSFTQQFMDLNPTLISLWSRKCDLENNVFPIDLQVIVLEWKSLRLLQFVIIFSHPWL